MFRAVLLFSLVISVLLPDMAFAKGERQYIGVGLGQTAYSFNKSHITNKYSQLSSSASMNPSDTSVKFFGGLRMDNVFALEYGLPLFGEAIASDGGTSYKLFDLDSLFATAMFIMPYSRKLEPFAKVGVHFWSLRESFTKTIDDGLDQSFGMGVNFNVDNNRHRMLRVELEHYDYNRIYLKGLDMLSFSLFIYY